jgi:hypothetical protein
MAYSQDIGRTFWYEFDNATQGTPAFMRIVRQSGAGASQRLYREAREAGTYPVAFLANFAGHRPDWVTIAAVQTGTITRFLGSDWADVQAAFEDFGQGTLLDAHPDRLGDWIHMMDTGDADPIGYHRWHASIRAIQLLKIGDEAWWEQLDTLVGLAWAIQSFARPKQQETPNPPIPGADLQRLRDAWLPMKPEMRDAQFDLPIGYHPSPMQPVAMI